MSFNQNTFLGSDWEITVNVSPEEYGDLVDSLLSDSMTYTSSSSTNSNRSTCCTIDGKYVKGVPISKSIDKEIQMTIDNRPIHLYFNRNIPENFFSTELTEKQNALSNKIHYCDSWSELSEKMKLSPKSVCFHVNELTHSSAIEIVNMVNTLSKLLDLKHEVTVTVGIETDTPYSVVKELQKSNIFGIIPSMVSYSSEEVHRGLVAQWNKIPYWPKHIIDKLPGAKKHEYKKPGEVKLTLRQQQILDLIKERGASNKVIAKTLNITESTVKLHVGIVLKKFGVKNRTQLALFSK